MALKHQFFTRPKIPVLCVCITQQNNTHKGNLRNLSAKQLKNHTNVIENQVAEKFLRCF